MRFAAISAGPAGVVLSRHRRKIVNEIAALLLRTPQHEKGGYAATKYWGLQRKGGAEMNCPMCGEQVATGEKLCECGFALGPAIQEGRGAGQQLEPTEVALRPPPLHTDQATTDPDEEVFERVLKNGFWKASRKERGTYQKVAWRKMPGLSKAAVILGGLSFVPVFSLIAIPTGVLALVLSRTQPEYRIGRGMVIGGLAVACLLPVSFLLLFILTAPI